jgi:hypothetical protein
LLPKAEYPRQDSNIPQKSGEFQQSTKSAAPALHFSGDSGLDDLIAAWPSLPVEVRTQIMQILNRAIGE